MYENCIENLSRLVLVWCVLPLTEFPIPEQILAGVWGDGAAHPPRGRPAQPGPGQARQGGGPHGQAGLRQEGDTGGSSALLLLPWLTILLLLG